ncbi:sensor histidine kinase [Vibrio fluvialis]
MKKKKCIKHYQNIREKQGFYVCPAGLTTYSSGNTEDNCFSSLKINGYYDITKTKRIPDFIPTIPPQVFLESINKSNQLERHKSNKFVRNNSNTSLDSDIVDFSIHEVRRFNGEIKRICEELLIEDSFNTEVVTKKIKSIFASSSLISVRLNAFDLEENPDVITSQSKFNSGIFKKFQKASHCLNTYARDRGVTITQFKGSSHLTIDMYQIFDLIPFVILENSIKYSPSGQNVTVYFDEVYNKFLSVTVSSIGPCNATDEMEKIFEKKYRGKQAAYLDGTGGGYGLYFAKLICDMHNIHIKANSGPEKFELNGVAYSDFSITLEIAR